MKAEMSDVAGKTCSPPPPSPPEPVRPNRHCCGVLLVLQRAAPEFLRPNEWVRPAGRPGGEGLHVGAGLALLSSFGSLRQISNL